MGNIDDEVSVGYIRCTHCGTTYKVSGDELYEEDLTYHCHKCNNDFEVPFFTYCKECDEIIGVDNGSVKDALVDIAAMAIGGFIKPWTALGGVKRLLDDVPSAKGWGDCPFCNAKYIRCPRCLSPVEVRPGTGDHDILRCPDCGQKMRQP